MTPYSLIYELYAVQEPRHWDKKNFGVAQEGVQPADCIEVYVQSVGVHR